MKQKLKSKTEDEKTLFVKVLGDYPLIKVIDFLITFQEFDYSPTDIAKNAGISFITLQTFWNNLTSLEIVKKTRKVGNATLYKLNLNNPIVKKLLDLDLLLRKEYREKLSSL